MKFVLHYTFLGCNIKLAATYKTTCISTQNYTTILKYIDLVISVMWLYFKWELVYNWDTSNWYLIYELFEQQMSPHEITYNAAFLLSAIHSSLAVLLFLEHVHCLLSQQNTESRQRPLLYDSKRGENIKQISSSWKILLLKNRHLDVMSLIIPQHNKNDWKCKVHPQRGVFVQCFSFAEWMFPLPPT